MWNIKKHKNNFCTSESKSFNVKSFCEKGTSEMKNGSFHVSTQKIHGFNFNLNKNHFCNCSEGESRSWENGQLENLLLVVKSEKEKTKQGGRDSSRPDEQSGGEKLLKFLSCFSGININYVDPANSTFWLRI